MAKAFDALFDLDERAEIRKAHHASLDDVAELVSIKEAIPGVGLEILYRQTESPAVDVNICYDGVDLLTLLQNIRRMLDSFGPGDIRDVNESVDSVFDFDKR